MLRLKIKYRFFGTSTEGTRQVYTYTEVLSETQIEEYINDELIDSRPNPLGVIPVVHIPNVPVSGSPWGLSDIADVVPLNRVYNEMATDVADIVNYHSAPTVIITGAKASNLEKGPKRIWGGLPKDARVETLENGVELSGPMTFLDTLKKAMHEVTGVPESALGQMQPISNTSGVALAIQFEPLMLRYTRKKQQYSVGLQQINELVLKTLFTFEPETLQYDPDSEGIQQPGQPDRVDPADPDAYYTTCVWPAPLPVDVLVKLNEIQMKVDLGLESKVGALRELGEEFPDEKAAEIFEERMQDIRNQGALDLISNQIAAAILAKTGLPPDGVEAPAPQPAQSGSGGDSSQDAPAPPKVPVDNDTFSQLVTLAAGTKLPQHRQNSDDNND
jgi:hypothetical protein